MRKKNFILGLGAQKAGTTWLHANLMKSPNVDMGFRKEYHVFDAVFVKECDWARIEVLNKISEKNNNNDLGRNSSDYINIAKRLAFIDNIENYFDYFDYLYLKNEEVVVVGDITPSYSLLSAEALKTIKDGLESRGFDVHVVFLLRDPIERVWSSLRMQRRNNSRRGENFNTSEEEALLEHVKKSDVISRTQYNVTMDNIEKVFDQSKILFDFYERIVSEKGIATVEKFLSINIPEPDFKTRYNVSPKSTTLSDPTTKKLVQEFDEIYTCVLERFGADIKDIWPGFKHF